MNLIPIWAQGNLGEAENTSCHRAEMPGPHLLGSLVARAGVWDPKLHTPPTSTDALAPRKSVSWGPTKWRWAEGFLGTTAGSLRTQGSDDRRAMAHLVARARGVVRAHSGRVGVPSLGQLCPEFLAGDPISGSGSPFHPVIL